eukprot:gene46628-56087_t
MASRRHPHRRAGAAGLAAAVQVVVVRTAQVVVRTAQVVVRTAQVVRGARRKKDRSGFSDCTGRGGGPQPRAIGGGGGYT